MTRYRTATSTSGEYSFPHLVLSSLVACAVAVVRVRVWLFAPLTKLEQKQQEGMRESRTFVFHRVFEKIEIWKMTKIRGGNPPFEGCHTLHHTFQFTVSSGDVLHKVFNAITNGQPLTSSRVYLTYGFHPTANGYDHEVSSKYMNEKTKDPPTFSKSPVVADRTTTSYIIVARQYYTARKSNHIIGLHRRHHPTGFCTTVKNQYANGDGHGASKIM